MVSSKYVAVFFFNLHPSELGRNWIILSCGLNGFFSHSSCCGGELLFKTYHMLRIAIVFFFHFLFSSKLEQGEKENPIQQSWIGFRNVVGVAGFEPATSASQTRRDNRATLHPDGYHFNICGETGTRTRATLARRQISNLLHYHSGTSPIQL